MLLRQSQRGSWNVQNRHFVAPYQAASEHRWSYVQLVPPNNRYTTPDHLRIWSREVSRSLPLYGMTAQLDEDTSDGLGEHYLNITDQGSPTAVAQDEAILANFINAMKAGYARLAPPPELRLLFVLLPEKSVPLYALIKRVSDQLCGVRTICHVCRSVNISQSKQARPSFSWGPQITPGFLANILLKFNLKMNHNGANQALIAKGAILDDDTMLMGADVVCLPAILVWLMLTLLFRHIRAPGPWMVRRVSLPWLAALTATSPSSLPRLG